MAVSSAVGTTWFGTASLAHKGLTYSGLKIRNPDSTGGVPSCKVLVSGVGHSNRVTCAAFDRGDTLYWARGGNSVVITDPWERWRAVGLVVMMRFLFLSGRASREEIIARRLMSRERSSTRAAQWAITLPSHLQCIFERVYSYYS